MGARNASFGDPECTIEGWRNPTRSAGSPLENAGRNVVAFTESSMTGNGDSDEIELARIPRTIYSAAMAAQVFRRGSSPSYG